jgi:hypothetical protein
MSLESKQLEGVEVVKISLPLKGENVPNMFYPACGLSAVTVEDPPAKWPCSQNFEGIETGRNGDGVCREVIVDLNFIDGVNVLDKLRDGGIDSEDTKNMMAGIVARDEVAFNTHPVTAVAEHFWGPADPDVSIHITPQQPGQPERPHPCQVCRNKILGWCERAHVAIREDGEPI